MTTTDEAFVERYGTVYEHSPWVARDAASRITADDGIEQIAAVMAECVNRASREQRLALIRAHPDLAGRLRVGEALSRDSAAEQEGAGLDRLTPEEHRRFHELNDAYRARFGFPFVIAVTGKSRAEILDAFETRLHNDPDTEFETAIGEIHRIARIRLANLTRA